MRGTAARGPLIGLAVFLVIATALTWLVYVTLRRDVKGATVSLRSDVHRCLRAA